MALLGYQAIPRRHPTRAKLIIRVAPRRAPLTPPPTPARPAANLGPTNVRTRHPRNPHARPNIPPPASTRADLSPYAVRARQPPAYTTGLRALPLRTTGLDLAEYGEPGASSQCGAQKSPIAREAGRSLVHDRPVSGSYRVGVTRAS